MSAATQPTELVALAEFQYDPRMMALSGSTVVVPRTQADTLVKAGLARITRTVASPVDPPAGGTRAQRGQPLLSDKTG